MRGWTCHARGCACPSPMRAHASTQSLTSHLRSQPHQIPAACVPLRHHWRKCCRIIAAVNLYLRVYPIKVLPVSRICMNIVCGCHRSLQLPTSQYLQQWASSGIVTSRAPGSALRTCWAGRRSLPLGASSPLASSIVCASYQERTCRQTNSERLLLFLCVLFGLSPLPSVNMMS